MPKIINSTIIYLCPHFSWTILYVCICLPS